MTRLRVEYKNIDSLQEYENNPRDNDAAVEAVAESIDLYGFKVPIILDGDGIIIAGHTRLKAAKRLGMEQVPCIVVDDLDAEQVKAFRLADNRVAEQASWDFEMLAEEIQALNLEQGLTGFAEWELEQVTASDDAESLDEFFEDAQKKEKEPKFIQCPYCGELFES